MRTYVAFGYFVVEALVFYAVAKWLGVGTALLLLFGVFFGGLAVAMWQLSRLFSKARGRRLSARDSSRLLGDVGLVTAGAVCMALPGFASSVVGLVLVVPVTRSVVRRVMAKRLQERISVLGARSFERAYQARPRTSYGSFGAGAPIVVDESEIVQWSQSVEPEDFAGPRGSSDNESGKDFGKDVKG